MRHLFHSLERSWVACFAVTLAWNGIAAIAGGQQLLHTFTPRQAVSSYSPVVAFSSDDSRIALLDCVDVATDRTDPRQELRVWDLKTGNELGRLPVHGDFAEGSLTFLAQDKTVALYDGRHGELVVWDFQTGARHDVASTESASRTGAISVAFSRDRTLMATAEVIRWPRSVVRAQRVGDAVAIAEFKTGGVVRQLLFSSDGEMLVATDEQYDKRQDQFTLYVQQWDLQGKQEPQRWGPFPMTGSKDRDKIKFLGRYRLSPDARTLATTLPENGVLLIDILTGQQNRTAAHPIAESLEQYIARGYRLGGSPGTMLSSIAFTPDGYQLVTAARRSRDICFWPIRANADAGQIAQPDVEDIDGFQLSDSGRLLAVTGRRNPQYAVMVWRLPSR